MRNRDVERPLRAARMERDPKLDELQGLMQEGRWSEAEIALQALEAQYPGSDKTGRVRESLRLCLAVEESWAHAAIRPRPDWSQLQRYLQVPTVRGLLVANALLYLLLILLVLLGR